MYFIMLQTFKPSSHDSPVRSSTCLTSLNNRHYKQCTLRYSYTLRLETEPLRCSVQTLIPIEYRNLCFRSSELKKKIHSLHFLSIKINLLPILCVNRASTVRSKFVRSVCIEQTTTSLSCNSQHIRLKYQLLSCWNLGNGTDFTMRRTRARVIMGQVLTDVETESFTELNDIKNKGKCSAFTYVIC